MPTIKNTTTHIIDMPGVLPIPRVDLKLAWRDLKIAAGATVDVTDADVECMKAKPAIAGFFAAGHLVEVSETSAEVTPVEG